MLSGHTWVERAQITSALTVLAVVAGGSLMVAPPSYAATAPVTSAVTAPDEASAQRLAERTDSRVEVTSQRTEYSQMFAEPTGNFTYESAVVPQRVHRADGSWADVDLTLVAGGDGLIRPRVSVADVRFSDGGSGPLVTLAGGGHSRRVDLRHALQRRPDARCTDQVRPLRHGS